MLTAVNLGLYESQHLYNNRANKNYRPAISFCAAGDVVLKTAEKAVKTIAIGSDHGGLALKEKIAAQLRELGYIVKDMGTFSKESCDYPDFAIPVAKSVKRGKADRGILVCTTGVGVEYTANKFPKIRAVRTDNIDVAKRSRDHNNTNILCLGADTAGDDKLQIVKTWLETPFSQGVRHIRRINKANHARPWWMIF